MRDAAYAYLHGFASGPSSLKGLYLRNRLRRHGIDCALLDGNVPSFESMTYSAVLAMLDGEDRAREPAGWRMIGSSMGGYLAARWAELRPDRVDGLVLLCPGFDLMTRWPVLVGHEAFEAWKRTGRHRIDDGTGTMQPLHWEFVVDSGRHPRYPEVSCPTLVIHGTHDEVVPIEMSRRFARERSGVRLVEVEDDHALAASLEIIGRETETFFDLR